MIIITWVFPTQLNFVSFFGDKTVYSLEHFIVGECGTLHVKTAKYDFPYKYPPTIQKYRNSLFNFIFKDGNKSFRYVYASYEQLVEFKNWLTKQNIKFPFVHQIQKMNVSYFLEVKTLKPMIRLLKQVMHMIFINI